MIIPTKRFDYGMEPIDEFQFVRNRKFQLCEELKARKNLNLWR